MTLVVDRATATFAPDQIGATRYLTPEGYLYCDSVRLARTGPMLYSPSEVPHLEPAPDGSMIVILRDADVLFSEETMASFSGKPATNDHPEKLVKPETFKQAVVGAGLNIRRGEGAESEYLIGDLLIMDRQAIADIGTTANPGPQKREISLGYDAEFEQLKPGLARVTSIVGNHIAIVKRGRAGPSCAIQDEEPDMALKPRRTMLDRLRAAMTLKDEDAIEQELTALESSEGLPPGITINVAGPPPPEVAPPAEGIAETDPTDERLTKLEAAVAAITSAVAALAPAEEPKVETGDEAVDDPEEKKDEEKEADKKETMDAVAKAEILAPGLKLPTMDGAVKGSAVTSLRRSALSAAYADPARKVHIDAVMGGRPAEFGKMRPSQVAVIFDAAAAVARAANNSGGRSFDIPQGKMTAAKMQERIVASRKRA